MPSIRKETTVEASVEKTYEALTAFEAYRSWWCRNSAVAEHEGGEALLHFNKDGEPVTMRFRIDNLEPSSRVVWECLANGAPPWVGTTLDWSVEPAGANARITLRHDGWKTDPPPMVADGWDHFLASLKSYVETGSGQPW